MLSWIDGRPACEVGLLDRGLAYGDGLFETIAVRAGKPCLLDAHLQRLARGCQRLQLTLDQVLLRQELLAFSEQLGDGVVKLMVTRGDGQRGYAFQAADARRILLASALPHYPTDNAQLGIELFDCQTRLARQPLLAGLKHLNRLEQVLARAEWQDSRYSEGLLRDTADHVIEGVFSNVFWISAGRLCTPSLTESGVAGVMREQLLAYASDAGVVVEIDDFQLPALMAADEVFVCNSLYGVWPVRRFQDRNWSIGPLTRKLQTFARSLTDD